VLATARGQGGELRIAVETNARPEDAAVVRDAINKLNVEITGDTSYERISVFLRDEGDEVRGGALGDIWGGWMHLDYLWVEEPLRGRGYGQKLLEAAEEVARARGCRGIGLETFSFQARPFYERRGYRIFATLPDYPDGHSFYFLKKMLDDESRD
jgi:GNAT superfamily N-acetyltransferase